MTGESRRVTARERHGAQGQAASLRPPAAEALQARGETLGSGRA